METVFNIYFDRYCGKKDFILASQRKDIVTMRGSFIFFFHQKSVFADIGLAAEDISVLTDIYKGPPTIEEAFNYAVKKICGGTIKELKAAHDTLTLFALNFGINIDFKKVLRWHKDSRAIPQIISKTKLAS